MIPINSRLYSILQNKLQNPESDFNINMQTILVCKHAFRDEMRDTHPEARKESLAVRKCECLYNSKKNAEVVSLERNNHDKIQG